MMSKCSYSWENSENISKDISFYTLPAFDIVIWNTLLCWEEYSGRHISQNFIPVREYELYQCLVLRAARQACLGASEK